MKAAKKAEANMKNPSPNRVCTSLFRCKQCNPGPFPGGGALSVLRAIYASFIAILDDRHHVKMHRLPFRFISCF